MAIIIPITILGAVLERTLDDPCGADSNWIGLLAVGIFVAYVIAGFTAGAAVPSGTLSNGSLAGLGAFVLWIPVRLFIYAIRGDVAHCSHHIFTVGQIVAHLLFGAAFGMLGGYFGGRRASSARMIGGGESAGRPRAGIDPSEERPDSTGQGAG